MFVFTQLETGSEGTGYFTFCFMLCHTFQGQCLRHAQNCVKQARLVYLQIHLISAGIPVINLEPNQVRVFIETHDKFHEVSKLIIALSKMLILGLFVWYQSLLWITPCDSNFHLVMQVWLTSWNANSGFLNLNESYAVMSLATVHDLYQEVFWVAFDKSYIHHIMAMFRIWRVFLSCCKVIFWAFLCQVTFVVAPLFWYVTHKNQNSIAAIEKIRSHIVVVVVVFTFQSPTAVHISIYIYLSVCEHFIDRVI